MFDNRRTILPSPARSNLARTTAAMVRLIAARSRIGHIWPRGGADIALARSGNLIGMGTQGADPASGFGELTLSSSRLTLRPWRPADAAAVFEAASADPWMKQ